MPCPSKSPAPMSEAFFVSTLSCDSRVSKLNESTSQSYWEDGLSRNLQRKIYARVPSRH